MASPAADSPSGSPVGHLRRTARSAFRLAAPYWLGAGQSRARALLAALIASKFAIVYLCLAQNRWYGDFYTALQGRDAGAFWRQAALFAAIAGAYAATFAVSIWLSGAIKARWRAALTQSLATGWLEGAFWRSKFGEPGLDQPEQRMSADADAFVGLTLDLVIGALDVGTSLIAFTSVLAHLSGALSLGPVSIPGYMVVGAYVFTFLSSLVTHRLGRPLAGVYATLSEREADLRSTLARVSEHAESIAFHRGEVRERASIAQRIESLREGLSRGLKQERALHLFGHAHGQGAIILPFLLAAPRYFSGEIGFGEVMQVVAAFASVTACLNFFIHSYGQIAHWSAATARVAAFRAAIDAPAPNCELTRATAGGLAVENLRLQAPGGRPLVSTLDISAAPGEALLVRGPSGAGKSTLLRALAGLWPYAHGRVALAHHSAMFLPQKPYVPPGSMKAAACYPFEPQTVADDVVVEALTLAGLPGFALMLHEEANWSAILSGGEQQRLAFARVLVARPEIIFLDEATSALDEPTEKRLYEALRNAPWSKTLVSVGHRSTLLDLHDRTVELGPAGISAAA